VQNPDEEQQVQGDLHRDEQVSRRGAGRDLAQDRVTRDEREALGDSPAELPRPGRPALRPGLIALYQEQAGDRRRVRQRIGHYRQGCADDRDQPAGQPSSRHLGFGMPHGFDMPHE
jgi:hypothetical protein